MEHQFNAEQQRVIAAQGGHHLVLAPPGCGKTAVLAERIACAHEHGVPFDQMACLTFTNRAARGMRERIMERLPDAEGLEQLFVGNVHRFCLHFLSEGGVVSEHSTVIDTDTSISIIADYLGDDELQVLGDNRRRQRYSQIINLQHLLYQCCKGHPSGIIVHRDALPGRLLRELCVAFGLPYNQTSTIRLYEHAADYRDDHSVLLSHDAADMLKAIYAARQYELYKRDNDLLDFEDLLLVTYDAVSAPHAADGTGQSRQAFSWLQVDEVQDLNPLQLAIIDAFTAPDATVVYLGDAQQAIFSFMGAQTDTLTMLRRRCGDDHFYTFYENYRSPQYLLDIFNAYGRRQLGIDSALLPTTSNLTARGADDVVLMEAPTSVDEANMVARRVDDLYHRYPDQTVAVVVAFNSDADEVSAALGPTPHFKISGTDFFATPPVRLLLSHLGVVNMEHDFIGWSNVFAGLQVYASASSARQAVRAMMQLAITPADLLLYDDGSTYVTRFVSAYEQRDMVVFDTETTGLDVHTDDVVQLAAVRVRQGRVVDQLDLFIHTNRPIPAMLGDVVNPLVEEYARQPHVSAAEAFERFFRFAQDCNILGHNATYDYQIMEANLRRHAPHLSMAAAWPHYFDTLKLARLLHPRQPSYKLRDLLVQLRLEGSNSHLASDDILATLSLATHCYECGRSLVGRQLEFLSRHRQMAQRFRSIYADLYMHTRSMLYDTERPAPPLVEALLYAYHYLKDMKRVPELPKLDYLVRYIELDLLTPASGLSLAQQLGRHYSELCTMKEADLCGAASMTERVFVSTVHKAKGLEFDSVIVYDAVEGKYPSAYADTVAGSEEEARKFYVAMSRARRRLVVSYCQQSVSRWGRWYPKRLTPFMDCIGQYF